MERRQTDLREQLQEAGFSTRTVNALIYHYELQDLRQLTAVDWGSVEDRTGLVAVLRRLANLGQKGIAEVRAFREFGDARLAWRIAPTSVSARLEPSELAALDVWADARGFTRTQAVRAILTEALRADG
ncbi:MAG: hypothetical protein IT546_03080 [Caulobacteraceae bacterium]|nr:hypothetical protein [Caulobacteraceae bacterium]